MTSGPIVIVEDDTDDCETLTQMFRQLGVMNDFKCFENGALALDYLRSTVDTPFIIISDIHMPMMSGLVFKKMINEDPVLRKRKIPFVFFSSIKESRLTEKVFELSVQGYFKKPDDSRSLREIVASILNYWAKSNFQSQEAF